mmetsp:Transcript_171/g.720  ORF Transcript_171/g.720 Transcript_171/m.720 type:complete len:216 (+) Transcript_171:1608-2255(+)
MRFVDSRRRGLRRRWVLKLVLFLGCPEDSVVTSTHDARFDSRSAAPGWDAIEFTSVTRVHAHFHARAVCNRTFRQCYLPRAKLRLCHRCRASVPAIEVTNQRQMCRRGRPLTVRHIACRLVYRESVLFVPERELLHRRLRRGNRSLTFLKRFISVLQMLAMRLEQRIFGDSLRAINHDAIRVDDGFIRDCSRRCCAAFARSRVQILLPTWRGLHP